MSQFLLYASPPGGSAIVEAALTLCGLEYETVDLEFERLGESDALQAINPLCQVPTLVLPDGRVMTESAAIFLYLAAEHPDAGLVPTQSSPAYAEFLRWMMYLVASTYPTFTYGDFPGRWVSGEAAEAELLASTNARRERDWQYLESVAACAPWFLGFGFTALDLYIWVMSYWRPGRAWFAEHCPGLHAIGKRLDADPRLQAVYQRNFATRY